MLQYIVTSMPMFVCGLFTLLLALDLRGRAERRSLLVFFATATLLYVGHFVYFSRNVSLVPLSDTVYAFCNVAVYPLYYVYLVALTQSPGSARGRLAWLTLVPALGCCAAIGAVYVSMSPAATSQFLEVYLYGGRHSPLDGLAWWQALAHDVAKAVFALQLLPVVLVGQWHIREFNRRVEANYADTDGRAVPGLSVLLWLFLLTAAISFVCNVVGRQWFGSSVWLLAVPSLVFSALLFLLGRAGLRQDFSIVEVLADEREALEAEAEVPADCGQGVSTPPVEPAADASAVCVARKAQEARREWQREVVRRIVDERLYLRQDLKLNEVALLIGTNRTYLGQAISEETGSTFSDFINRLRIQEAVRMQREQPDLPVADVVYRCGFANYSSFHRNFVKFAGKK